jgi:protein O-mannosyl-transferase
LHSHDQQDTGQAKMRSRRQLIILGLFLLGGFIAYSNILTSYFLSDDFAQIGRVLGGDLSVVWGKAQGGFFRPIFILSYLIDTKIWEARPLGFHLTNVAFHSLNAFLTFKLSLRLVKNLKLNDRTKRAIAIGAGALYLLHPSHTEAVTWISGRADVIATFFCLASLLSYLAYAGSKRAAQLALSLLCFTLALLAKEAAICLPFLVIVIGLFFGHARVDGKTQRRFLACLALFVSVLLAFVVVRAVFIGSLVGGYGVSQHLNFSPPWLRDRLLEASVRSVLPALPSQLSQFLFKPLQSRVFILFSLACAGLVVAVIMLRRRWYGPFERREQNRFLIAVGVLFLVSLLPVINLRLTLYQTLGERFLYLPTVFSCLLVAYLAAILFRRPALWLSILICILGFYSVRLYQTNQTWREAAALSRSVRDQLLDTSTRDHLLILNAPDNLRGVPVFHNGLPEALQYFQNPKPIKQVEIVAFEELQSAADEVTLTRHPESLSIQLVNEKDNFARVQPVECLEALAQSKTSLELQAKACAADADLFLFDKGRMIRLRDW